jgi:hypothetical protein
MQSSRFSPDQIPVKDAQHRSESLYPSRLQIEAIEIPDCQEVFLSKSSKTCRRETSSGCSIRNGSRSIRSSSGHQSPAPSCQDQLANYQARALSRKESSDGSCCSQPGMVKVMGPPHIPFDRKPSVQQDPVSRLEVEVAPGVFLPLHGSQETLAALREGQLVSCTCFVCTHTVMCVPQASYVLCPDCRVVSPVECIASRTRQTGGVGLGMKLEEYHREREHIPASSHRRLSIYHQI